MKNSVRIIAGKWRGRRIDFPNIAEIRPTPDRVRETLFNWLAPVIVESVCLDLFAGSGALGFEALSRGVKQVIFVDESAAVIQQLNTTRVKLKSENLQIVHQNAAAYLETTERKFDIVFLDPPFQSSLLETCCKLLNDRNLLNKNAYIYLETTRETGISFLPKRWHILKEKQAGKVKYLLTIPHKHGAR